MKILEIITLCLTIIVPLFFIGLLVINSGKAKRKKKYRNRLLKYALISLIINGCLFAGVKVINNLDRDSSITENGNNVVDSSNNMESGNESTTSDNKNTTSSDSTSSTSKPVSESANKTSKGFEIEVRDGVTYIDGYLVVNKTYSLPESYVPKNTYKAVNDTKGACAECLIKDAYNAYQSLNKDAKANGLTLWIASGFRSYSYQNGLYNSYVKRSGKEKADTYSARPGHSEHQSGYAFDLNTVDDSFANTKEGKWVNENCYKYGFIIRYPKGKDNETGYKYEPWHLRYVGVDFASKLYNAGDWITMEDYFGITSEYAN